MSTNKVSMPKRGKIVPLPLRTMHPVIKSNAQNLKVLRPPPIVIPIGTRSLPISNTPTPPLPKIKNETQDILKFKKVLHPLTPHVQVGHSLMPLIQRVQGTDIDHSLVFKTKNEFYLERDKVLNRSPSAASIWYVNDDPEVAKINETLNTILKLISDPIYRHGIPPETYATLIELSKENIFREPTKVELPSEFSEVSVIYQIMNWDNVDLYHQILKTLMLDYSNFSGFLNPTFSKKLVEALDTPVFAEQNAFEEIINQIINNFAGHRQDILKYMMEKVIAYIDGAVGSNVMAPLLRSFMSYFTSLKPPLKQSVFMTFRTVFYPLFATTHAYEFETPLRQISMFFQAQDPATAFWCLKYLSKHWPITNTKKVLLYLHELTGLVAYIPESVFQSAAPIIAKSFSCSIESPHVTTSVYAILFCQNDMFFSIFKNAPELVAKYIMPAVDKACNIWKTDAREIAESLKEKLSVFLRKKQNVDKRKEECSANTWNDIKSIASVTYDEFSK